MLKYAKVINEETKQCEVGIGTNAEFYKSIGMTEMEVEQAYNGSWYVKGFAPERPEAEIIAQQVAELKAELSSTDYKAIKFAEGWISEEDYAPIKAHRQELRDKINELENTTIQVSEQVSEQVEQEEPIVDTVGEEPETQE